MRRIRHFIIPAPLLADQKQNRITSDLYLAETGEFVIEAGQAWRPESPADYHFLLYCTQGEGFLTISGETLFIASDHFCIVPGGETFRIRAGEGSDCHVFTAGFDGAKAQMLSSFFSVARKVLPSVNNQVANRTMLFDELFNNLSRGFYNENLEYIHFCLGHLLATFIYAHKTDESDENVTHLMVQRVNNFLEHNLDKRLTLSQLARVAGFSPTYFTTLFSRHTGYAPLTYFSHLKILKACEYLDHTNNKIKDISFSLGYSDPYYFTRDFKKRMGISPRNYRNRVTSGTRVI